LNDTVIDAVDVHGPSQLLRAASLPSWLRRHSRAAREPLRRSDSIAVASEGSASATSAGSKTNARSFE
jgi:hypothetical protein